MMLRWTLMNEQNENFIEKKNYNFLFFNFWKYLRNFSSMFIYIYILSFIIFQKFENWFLKMMKCVIARMIWNIFVEKVCNAIIMVKFDNFEFWNFPNNKKKSAQYCNFNVLFFFCLISIKGKIYFDVNLCNLSINPYWMISFSEYLNLMTLCKFTFYLQIIN